jgi:hypothetical protein
MEDHVKLIEELLERAVDYGKTSYELGKLKALAKTSDVISSLLSHSVVILFIAVFWLFFSLGIAFLLGEILGKIWYGFALISAFYLFAGIFIRLFWLKWLKRVFANYIVKQVLK